MELFVSWSGPRSKAVAAVMRDEIPRIVHSAKPWVSDTHIPGGVGWFQAIEQAAADCSSAIIVVTPENQGAPWLNFEAGAFALLGESKAVPLLVGFDDRALDPAAPLSQVNNERLENRDRMRAMLSNLAPDEHQRRQARRAFDDRWDGVLLRCEEALATPLDPGESVPAPPSPDEVNMQLLTRMQSIERMLEQQVRPPEREASPGERLSMAYHPSQLAPATRTQVQRVLKAMADVDGEASPFLPPSWHHAHQDLKDLVSLVASGSATSALAENAYNQATLLLLAAQQEEMLDARGAEDKLS